MDRTRVSQLNEQRIATLHPVVQIKAKEFVAACESEYHILVLVTDGYRSFAEQDKLYARGRSGDDKRRAIVTWVRGGHSFHNYGAAIDYLPLSENPPGEFHADWNAQPFLDNAYRDCRLVASRLGWDLLNHDRPHLQWVGSRKWTAAALEAAGYGTTMPLRNIPFD